VVTGRALEYDRHGRTSVGWENHWFQTSDVRAARGGARNPR
jgi:hypothetical protein